jgi:hypothetical protein
VLCEEKKTRIDQRIDHVEHRHRRCVTSSFKTPLTQHTTEPFHKHASYLHLRTLYYLIQLTSEQLKKESSSWRCISSCIQLSGRWCNDIERRFRNGKRNTELIRSRRFPIFQKFLFEFLTWWLFWLSYDALPPRLVYVVCLLWSEWNAALDVLLLDRTNSNDVLQQNVKSSEVLAWRGWVVHCLSWHNFCSTDRLLYLIIWSNNQYY